MRLAILCLALFGSNLFAQSNISGKVIYVWHTDPTGMACQEDTVALYGAGLYTCQSGVYALATGGSSYTAGSGIDIVASVIGIDPGWPGVTGPGYGGLSSTSLTPGTGAVSLTTGTGLAWQPGDCIQITSSAAPTAFMRFPVTTYDTVTGILTGTVAAASASTCSGYGGSGAHTDWRLGPSGANGRDGTASSGDVVGPSGATADDIATYDTTTGKLIKDSGIGSSVLSGSYVTANSTNAPANYRVLTAGTLMTVTEATHALTVGINPSDPTALVQRITFFNGLTDLGVTLSCLKSNTGAPTCTAGSGQYTVTSTATSGEGGSLNMSSGAGQYYPIPELTSTSPFLGGWQGDWIFTTDATSVAAAHYIIGLNTSAYSGGLSFAALAPNMVMDPAGVTCASCSAIGSGSCSGNNPATAGGWVYRTYDSGSNAACIDTGVVAAANTQYHLRMYSDAGSLGTIHFQLGVANAALANAGSGTHGKVAVSTPVFGVVTETTGAKSIIAEFYSFLGLGRNLQ